jgi:hypothetical protein
MPLRKTCFTAVRRIKRDHPDAYRGYLAGSSDLDADLRQDIESLNAVGMGSSEAGAQERAKAVITRLGITLPRR